MTTVQSALMALTTGIDKESSPWSASHRGIKCSRRGEVMELDELMKFARAYNKLGWSIQEQLDDIVNGDCDDINPNALEEIDNRMRGFNDDLDEAIDRAMETATT